MGKEIIMLPLAAMGHLNPMVELGKLLHHHGLSITILISQSHNNDNKSINSYISHVSTTHPFISFHHLPTVSAPPDFESNTFLQHLSHTIPHIKAYLSATTAQAIVLDIFFDAALDVATEFNIASYFFFSSNASNLAAFLYLPTLHNKLTASFKDLGETPIYFPSFPGPIPASDMPMRTSDRTSEAYKAIIVLFERYAKSAGIIVNSFHSLEPKALRVLTEGDCVPGQTMPPVYFVGPITAKNELNKENRRHESLQWLDAQPSGSVIFLCFGSMGSALPEAQIREIAVGLERSGQRFLWVANVETILPEGFLERTKERGLVVKTWVPQVAVLGHLSVGGFVTHCGWNSVLESIVAGVGMIAWPLYAEQRMNKVFLVEEAKLAVEMRGYKNEIVESGEIEERVRWLMESEGGKELRERVAAVGESGRAALKEGGSSYEAMREVMRVVSLDGSFVNSDMGVVGN